MARRECTTLEFALLGVISLGKHSAYDVHRLFIDSPMSQFSSSPGSIYPALSRLEKRGLLRSELERSARTQTRRTYELTKRGEEVFDEWLARDPNIEEIGWDLRTVLLRFSFMEGRRTKGQIVDFLRMFRDVLVTYREDLEQRLREFRAMPALHAELSMELGVMSFTIHIEWVDHATKEILSRGKEIGSRKAHSGGKRKASSPADRKKH